MQLRAADSKGRNPDYFVDAARYCALESAPACDSVACSALFKGDHREGVFHSVAEVKIQEGESIESALRRFKRKVQQEDIIKDIKKHSFYLKPGDKRRAKQALARKRNRKKLRRESE
jgi:small subunit ribosomal protein S21